MTKALRVQSRVTRHAGDARRSAPPLPGHAVLDISGTTGTVRWLGNLDGYLTGRSSKSPTSIALGYVRKNHAALGLTAADIKTFHLGRDYRDITGTHHLFFTQRIKGNKHRPQRPDRLGEQGRPPADPRWHADQQDRPRTKLPPASAYTIRTAAEALARTRGPELAGAATGDDTAQRVVFETGERSAPGVGDRGDLVADPGRRP